MKRIIILLVLVTAGAAFAGKIAICKVPVVSAPVPVIDAKIGSAEYAAGYTDPKTGIKVYWQADSAVLYCALQSQGAGWLSIGLGSGEMNGADMLIAYIDSTGEWAVAEHIGKSFFRHTRIDQPKLIAGKAGLTGGKTVMEFAMPLAMSNGKIVSSDVPQPFILAYHKDKTFFSKHTKKSAGSMILSAARSGK